jgi:hypothetical protein
VDGERIRRTTKLRSGTPLHEIRAAVRDIEAGAKAAAHARRRFRFGQLVDLYLERADKALHESNAKIAERWCTCLGPFVLKDLTPARIEAATVVMGHGCQPQSVQKYKRILRAILNYGVELDLIAKAPRFPIGRTPRSPRRRTDRRGARVVAESRGVAGEVDVVLDVPMSGMVRPAA